MAKLVQIIVSIAILTLMLKCPCQSEAASGGFCSPVLPPPIPECRIGSISVTKSRELEGYIKGNFTAAQRYLMEIANVTACHPDYLSLNQVSYSMHNGPGTMVLEL